MRVHELARELGVPNKELMARLRASGVTVTSHMNAVEEEIVRRLRAESAPSQAKPTQPSVPSEQPLAEAGAEPTRPAPAEPAAPPVEGLAKAAPVTSEKPVPERPGKNVITLRGAIIVKELAEQMGMKPNQLITELMLMNVFASINERVDLKVAQQIAEKHGFILEHEKKTVEQKPSIKRTEEDEPGEDQPEDLEHRPPVVTFLGHIDHGKTSLLDRIRNSSVAKSEAGGITQHIGAYTITRNGQKITFLDTPGHAAFTAMRARGANLTDVAVVVIAADDGVMPQTEEAIKHVQAADTAILVAINKIDMPAANPERVMRQLQAMDLTPEEWGGAVICCLVSAVTGEGIDHLLEMILLQAEMMELKANPKTRAKGYVIEARLEPGMGPTANLLVTGGTLHVGDIVVCGPYWGRVKALINDHGVKVRTATPSTPVKCMGLSGVPLAGERFRVYLSDKIARSVTDSRRTELRADQLVAPKKASLNDLFDQMGTSKRLELRLILKCDMQGSLEAIQQALNDINSEKVSIRTILGGVGNINVNDVLLASASNAIIVGFNVSKEPGVAQFEKQEGVEIRFYGIIYDILDEIKKAMTGMLAPEIREKAVGKAEVRQIFAISKKGKIAGCLVTNGRVGSRCKARVKRGEGIIYEGSIMTLKRFQDEASEVREGMECGVRLDNFSAFEPGDVIEFFEVELIPQEL